MSSRGIRATRARVRSKRCAPLSRRCPRQIESSWSVACAARHWVQLQTHNIVDQSVENVQSVEIVENVESVENVKNVENVETVETVESVETVEAVESVEAVGSLAGSVGKERLTYETIKLGHSIGPRAAAKKRKAWLPTEHTEEHGNGRRFAKSLLSKSFSDRATAEIRRKKAQDGNPTRNGQNS